MSVVLSLLRAIDRADGEALVMHVGEKPYVVTATGHAELAAKALTIPAMNGMLEQLLPADSRQLLDELGAVEYQLPPQPHAAPDIHYSVVAARGGDDIWIEVRRRKVEPEPVVAPVPETQQAPAAPVAIAVAAAEPETYTLETSGPIAVDEPAPTAVVEVEPEPILDAAAPEPEPTPAIEPLPVEIEEPHVAALVELQPAAIEEVSAEEFEQPAVGTFAEPDVVAVEEPYDLGFEQSTLYTLEDANVAIFEEAAPPVGEQPRASVEESVAAQPQLEAEVAEAPVATIEVEETVEHAPEPVAAEIDVAPAEEPEEQDEPEPVIQHHRAPVVPMVARVAPRHDVTLPPPSLQPRGEGLLHLLHVAAAQGASVLYVAVQAKPSLRVDGEIRVLDQETPLTEALLESGLKTVLPNGAVGEIETCDVPGVGRVQCLSFRDHRGLGAMFKMLPARAISSEQMGLSAPIQSLCTETEGLVLVSGGRGAGKSTLVAALVDQINRTRRDHVITVEHQIQFVHENRHSFVSQREARDEEAFADAVRCALREGPDVLVLDQVASTEAAEFALHAAAGGHLVIASITAATTSGALSRFMEFFGEERADARYTLSEHLRGVITQSLLRKTGGGRAAAREVLVNVPSVAALVADGHFDQLGSVLNGGRRVGMVPLNDALLALVQSGALDVREAYRKSPDQQELVGQLNRAGLDTTFAERLA